jgi:hypothetical protein
LVVDAKEQSQHHYEHSEQVEQQEGTYELGKKTLYLHSSIHSLEQLLCIFATKIHIITQIHTILCIF